MFSKVALFVAASMAVFVAAIPTPTEGINNSCDTGPAQCCNQQQAPTSQIAQSLAGLLNADLTGAAGTVGISCTPILSAIGGGDVCKSQPVCCSNNSFNGIIAIGCSPININ